ncbi:MAG: YaaR family protein [Defluviitaleaceae bacterium]|nr:YaaR family protein [Defluviitaleaceae bacterium]
MRVSDILATQYQAIRPAAERPEKADFGFTLNKLDDEGLAVRLRGLIDDITAQGNHIAEHMDIKDMKRYRGLVADFINEVVTHGHKFSRENFLDKRGRHRVYGIIKLVNEDLDKLAQELLKSEKDHIAILEKTDEIRGLLLDIIV